MPHNVNTSSLLDQIVAAHQRGDLARAEILCRQVIAAEPGNFQAWYMLAGLAFQQQSGPDALAAVNKALALNRKSAEAFNLKGAVLRAMDRKDEALESFSAALKLLPDNPDLWLNRSSVLGDLGRTEDALADV